MKILSILFRLVRKAIRIVRLMVDTPITKLYLLANGVTFGTDLKSRGIPYLNIWGGGNLIIGNNFVMNNGRNNPIGREQRCSFVVANGGALRIGNNVGVSSLAIVCHEQITIGNNVKIGGNVVIYDTDFHSLDADQRACPEKDSQNTKTSPVHIGHNVFIGAHCVLLKGSSIGDNSIVGAGSIVTRSVPAGEIWAGNPARRIGVDKT
jgi:acetyltransferase-like isoleucine patch superfamily enzyme